MSTTRCPTCGQEAQVHVSPEGTQSFVPPPEQGTLTWPPPEHKARRSDPSTSKSAAQLAWPRAGTHRARIVEALEEYGPLTTEQIEQTTGITYVTASTRVSDLRHGGWVEAHGESTTSNGAPCNVWRLTEAALQHETDYLLAEHERAVLEAAG